ncbi:MAG: phosphoribosylformylglycinamidine synthase subunit PurQ [Alkalispirochaeta sp.]
MVSLIVAPRDDFDVTSQRLTSDLRDEGLLHRDESVRVLRWYQVSQAGAASAAGEHDVSGAEPLYQAAVSALRDPTEEWLLDAPEDVFAEDGGPPATVIAVAVRYHAGQFDQRADAAEQVLQLYGLQNPVVTVAEVCVFRLHPADSEVAAARRRDFEGRLVNPVDSEVVDPASASARGSAGNGADADGSPTAESPGADPTTSVLGGPAPAEPASTVSARATTPAAAARADPASSVPGGPAPGDITTTGLNSGDREFVTRYFADAGRPPTETELAVIDTYWSDHCRHTTFRTELSQLEIAGPPAAGPARRADPEAPAHPSAAPFHHPDALTAAIQESYQWYLSERQRRGETDRPITLMDLATALMRWRRADGTIPNVVFSEEINACTVRISADTPGLRDAVDPAHPWLVLFKNETHNHPTEIEPFGGAATCLGGAIRDPLSGRAYVYQAMRITGSADPRRQPIGQCRTEGSAESSPRIGTPTLPGKLPQRLITTGAARGYSSYGNQIGVATGLVDELYHPGYRAKRLEMGAVVGAVPEAHVRREEPAPGDLVLLVGGRTGRDGVGGATGSSKSHSQDSIERAGAEVQKGNPPVERALQRLFRRGDFTRLVKRSNDFGAGGVAVAVGEIADGLEIDLSAVPLKYEGLTATEIAISESQERMAVVVEAGDLEAAIALAQEENLEATAIARVTAEPRLVMRHHGETVVDLSRTFVDSAGVRGRTAVRIAVDLRGEDATAPGRVTPSGAATDRSRTSVADSVVISASAPTSPVTPAAEQLLTQLEARLQDLRFASRLSLGEWFDSSIGAGTLLAHGAGRLQRSPVTAMAARLPHSFAAGRDDAENRVAAVPEVATVMGYGFDPDESAVSPWCGAYAAVVESVSRLAAAGVPPGAIWLSLQEYFPRPGDDPLRWGLPAAALLGALAAQRDLGVTAIGGKDSMSGSYEKIDVPPTLISVALGVTPAAQVVPPHLAEPGRTVYLLPVPRTAAGVPDADAFLANHRWLAAAAARGEIAAAAPVRGAGWLAAVVQMCFGENLGFQVEYQERAFEPDYGSLLVQFSDAAGDRDAPRVIVLGRTSEDGVVRADDALRRTADLYRLWSRPLQEVFPDDASSAGSAHTPTSSRGCGEGGGVDGDRPELVARTAVERPSAATTVARPRVLIPVFPGTNCEDDTAAAFEAAGAVTSQFVLHTGSTELLRDSLRALAAALANSEILMLPGGFSAGDEPAGSGKYLAAVLRSPAIRDVIERDFIGGDRLILGICNGFQALVRTGLVPFGEFVDRRPGLPALAPNRIGRHVSRRVLTRIDSTLGAWMASAHAGENVAVPVSHGEGRFVCGADLLADLDRAGQVAARYVDSQGRTRDDRPWNPNGSDGAVEALLSPDGRFLGKMGHTERARPGLDRHLPPASGLDLFAAGVSWFQ